MWLNEHSQKWRQDYCISCFLCVPFQVQSGCDFIHTDGKERVYDNNCLCGPEKIPQHDKTTRGPNSNSPYTSNENYSPISVHFQHKRVCKKITNWKGTVKVQYNFPIQLAIRYTVSYTKVI